MRQFPILLASFFLCLYDLPQQTTATFLRRQLVTSNNGNDEQQEYCRDIQPAIQAGSGFGGYIAIIYFRLHGNNIDHDTFLSVNEDSQVTVGQHGTQYNACNGWILQQLRSCPPGNRDKSSCYAFYNVDTKERLGYDIASQTVHMVPGSVIVDSQDIQTTVPTHDVWAIVFDPDSSITSIRNAATQKELVYDGGTVTIEENESPLWGFGFFAVQKSIVGVEGIDIVN